MSKLKAMKTAVNHFIDSVAAQKNGETPVAHRISIVKFAGDQSDKVDNDTYTDDDENICNYTQKVTELTDVTDEGSVDSLKDAVNALTAGGATAADWGMQKAEDVLTKRGNKENPSIVIMFTDGQPNHHRDYDKAVAGATVDIAKTLKAAGTKVYTIGMFEGADPGDTTTNFNKYMNGVSSNYPEAVKANNNSGVTLGTRVEGSNYYFKADNAGDLDKVFQTISQSTTTTSPLDASAVVVDKVPSNFEAPISKDNVTLKVADYKADGTFGTETAAPSTIHASVNEDGTVSVTGFNFSENWCGLDGTTPNGKKLIIEFTIKCTNYGGTQPTNDGAYIKAKADDANPIIKLDYPTVPVKVKLPDGSDPYTDTKVYDGAGFDIKNEIGKIVANLVPVDGIKNQFIDLTYEIKDSSGKKVGTYTIPAGETTGTWNSNEEIKTGSDADTYNYTITVTGQDKEQTSNYDSKECTATFTIEKKEKPKPSDPVELDVSRSKTASGLTKNSNGDWTTDVTLSIPSSEKQLVSDVLFILDESSCSESVKASVNSMLDALYKQIENSGAKIKVGAVQFRGNVTTLPLTELTDETKTKITSFMSSRPEVGGTNMSAGLLKAQKMLDDDTSVMNGRKYVILVSDGITYIWDDEMTDAQENLGVNFANADSPNNAMLAGPDGWDVKYGKSYIPENWESHFNGINSMMSTTIQNKASNYERGDNATIGKSFVAYGEKEQYTSTVDIALYKSYNAYKALQEKYNTYAVCSGVEKDMTDFPFGPSFMTYLADRKNVTFNSIQNDILYAVSAGSTVTDTIGEKFTFGGVDSFTLKVGTKEIKGVKDASDANTVNFGEQKSNGKYQYTVTYTPDTKTFVWTINENVSNFAPVQLTYTVKLTKPETAAATYGQTDLDGDTFIDGTQTKVDTGKALYTNQSATMIPKDSNGNEGKKLTFPKPSVSYTVSSGSSGSHSGGSRPSLNTKDHYGYIIGYPVDYYTGQPTTDQTKKPVRPEGKITRAEVATIYFRMLTDESRTKFWSQNSGYSDVKTGDWFNNAVSTLSNAGIIAGYEDGSFRPNGYITRAEFATIAARFFDVTYNGKDLFPDISGHWAKDYINQAANKGFVNGYEDGTFKPDRNITRAEAVTLVNRTLDRHPDKNHFTKDMLVWPDNMDQTKWYYADMQEATNSHTYQMKENSDKTKYENWTKTLPIRNWEALEKAWSNANSSQGNGNVV